MGFDWEHFVEDTDTPESRNELLNELQHEQKNLCIFMHIQAYSKLRQLNLEAAKLHIESNSIQDDLTNVIDAFQRVVT
jgi:hypothetical protein